MSDPGFLERAIAEPKWDANKLYIFYFSEKLYYIKENLVPMGGARGGLSPTPAVADLHSKILDARPPPGGPNSFNFMQFLGNFGKIVCWRPPGELATHLGEKSWICHCPASPGSPIPPPSDYQ